MSRIVSVCVPGAAYDVEIGSGLLDRLGEILAGRFPASAYLLLSDSLIAGRWQSVVEESCRRAHLPFFFRTLDFREETKSLATIQSLYQLFLECGIDRQALVVAMGGGVIGDTVGFAAATFLRGVGLMQIPTTLLAQVDSSIGGKVGVNFGGLKNYLGAFWQPKVVLTDPNVLQSLPHRQFMSGMAEVIKYALIEDQPLFRLLEDTQSQWVQGHLPPDTLEEILERCVRVKARVVAEDERESGLRAILNFGHTLGHAMELEKEGQVTHGEAIALGMSFALELSCRKGLCERSEFLGAERLLEGIPCPLSAADIDFSRLWDRMNRDKKRIGKSLRMVLLKGLRHPILVDVEEREVKELFQEFHLWWRKGRS